MRGGSKGTPTISTILYDYLASKKKPAHYRELTEHVKARRKDLQSRDLGATIRCVLRRDDRFASLAEGLYGLREW